MKDGEPVAFEETADIALKIIEIIKARYIVHVWTNDVAQNNMRNGIDDYFFDVLRDQKGIELPSEVMDDRELKILHLARASFQDDRRARGGLVWRSEEHTYELQSLMRISYAVFCLKKKQIMSSLIEH